MHFWRVSRFLITKAATLLFLWFTSYKHLMMLEVVAVVLTLIIILRFKESPQFLANRGKFRELKFVLHSILRKNFRHEKVRHSSQGLTLTLGAAASPKPTIRISLRLVFKAKAI